MPNVFKRLTCKVKDKIAQRNYKADCKYINDDFRLIASAFEHYENFGHHCNGPDEDVTEDDASSVSSFSTTATTDDNPGAGYTVDKYFYQPAGRRIEKIAFRIAMPLLSPFRIFQYIEEHHFNGRLDYQDFCHPPYRIKLKTVYLAGLDSLVHQTRSKSLMRSSAALSALIRLCPTDDDITCFFHLVHNQIGHPNLALSLIDNDTQEKKCYLFLMALVRARPDLSWDRLKHGYNNNYTEVSHSNLKETLLKLVNSWRYSNKDAFAIMSEASLHFAQALYHLLTLEHSEDFELVYFFTIFMACFIPFLYNNSTSHSCRQQAQHLCYMLLLTFLRWLDAALSCFVSTLNRVMRRWNTPHMLQAKLAIDSLLLHDPVFATLLPASTDLLREVEGLSEEALPRKQRHRGEHLTIKGTFIRASIPRTQRLLMSLDELEREIRDSMSRPSPRTSDKNLRYYKLDHAQCVHVVESELSKEFLEARSDWRDWVDYERRRWMRHEWGIYLRSNLDWDWDTTNYLQRLFELPEEVIAPPAPIATVSLDRGNADTWNLSTEISLPKQMRVAYKSSTGETKFRTILFSRSSDDVASAGHIEEVRDEASAITPASHCAGGEEAKDVPGAVTETKSDAIPMRVTNLELRVKYGVERQKEVSLIPEKPHRGTAENTREELEVVVGEGGCDTFSAQETEEGPEVYGDGGDCTRDAGLEELLKNREAIPGQHPDQISICSVY